MNYLKLFTVVEDFFISCESEIVVMVRYVRRVEHEDTNNMENSCQRKCIANLLKCYYFDNMACIKVIMKSWLVIMITMKIKLYHEIKEGKRRK